MGHDTASMHLELNAQRPATTPLRRLITVSRKKATEPVQIEVELTLEIPTARAKQLGWLVSFDFHH